MYAAVRGSVLGREFGRVEGVGALAAIEELIGTRLRCTIIGRA